VFFFAYLLQNTVFCALFIKKTQAWPNILVKNIIGVGEKLSFWEFFQNLEFFSNVQKKA